MYSPCNPCIRYSLIPYSEPVSISNVLAFFISFFQLVAASASGFGVIAVHEKLLVRKGRPLRYHPLLKFLGVV